MAGHVNGVRYIQGPDVYNPPSDSKAHAESDSQQALDAANDALLGAKAYTNAEIVKILAHEGILDITDPAVAALVGTASTATRTQVDGRVTALAVTKAGHDAAAAVLLDSSGSDVTSAMPAAVGRALAQVVITPTGGALDHARVQGGATQAASEGKRLYAAGSYSTSSTLTITSDADLGGLTINYTGTGTAVHVGTNSGITWRKTIHLPLVNNASKSGAGWAAGTVGVRTTNLNACQITVPQIKDFETGLLNDAFGQGHVHCTYNLGELYNNKRNHIVKPGSSGGWVNSNLYLGGRFHHDAVEGVLTSGLRHILLDDGPNRANGNTWDTPSVEGLSVQFAIDVDGGLYNTFLNARLEASHGARIRWGANASDNTILTGYSLATAVVTRVAGETRNNIWSASRFELFGNGSDPMMRLVNSTSPAAPALGVYKSGETDPAKWAWAWSAQVMRGRRPEEAFNRVEIDALNGRLALGDGSMAPKYLGAVGTSGIGMHGGNFYFSPDNTHDIGLATSLRPRDVNAARYVRVGTIMLRDNAGVLEKSTNGSTWEVV